MRVRGLKRKVCLKEQLILVAPHAGAWIETRVLQTLKFAIRSHPMRVRGLKQKHEAQGWFQLGSHPMRVRGLKHCASGAIIGSGRRTPCGCVD